MSPADYTPFTTQIIFPSSVSSDETRCTNVSTIVDDLILEDDETFIVDITSVYPPVTIGSPSSVMLTIIDNESEFIISIYIISIFIFYI